MRKKVLLFVALLSLLACIFAMGISAADFESNYTTEVTKFYDADGVKELLPTWANVTDKEATAVIKKADGNAVRIPAYYVVKTNGASFNKEGTNLDFSWITEKLGEEITVANLVALDVPNDFTSFSGGISTTYFPALEELVIPTSVTSLGQSMFRNNTVIRKVFVRQVVGADGNVQGVTRLPGWFADITNGSTSHLESFDFELDYVTSIGDRAFDNSAIKSFTVKAPMTSLGNTAFNGCKYLETVSINNTADVIGPVSTLFQGCINIKSINLNGISIGGYFLQNANALTEGGLTLVATNVASISAEAFKKAVNLSNVDISGPITSIGNSIFLECKNLTNVRIYNELETPATGGNSLCDNLATDKLTSVVLHGIAIGNYAFRNLGQNTSLTSECTVVATNIGSIGTEAFKNADIIVSIYVEGPFTSVNSGHVFRDNGKLKELTIINTGDTLVTMGNGEVNPELTDLTIKGKFTLGTMENSGNPLFQQNSKLKNVYLGTGVQSIGQKAFYKCYALEKVHLADTITQIGDRAFDFESANVQTSESFTFVDENGNMDNTLPTSLTYIGGHFLKRIKIANTELIFPESFTNHDSDQDYDFEDTILPANFRLIYLGKMTAIDLRMLQNSNVTVYLTKNSASELTNPIVYAYIDGTTISDNGGVYFGTNTNGTLTLTLNDYVKNGLNPSEYIKYYFCGSDEVVFLTRRSIPKGEGTSASWDNFVTTPVTYAQLTAAGVTIDKHPILSAPAFSPATCTEDGGIKTYCLGCGQIASIEKTEDALGHNFDYINSAEAKLIAIAYASYDKMGTKTVSCGNCGEHEEFDAAALFVNQGFSQTEYEAGSILISFVINHKALDEYKQITGNELTYGIFAIAQQNAQDENSVDKEIVNADGTTIKGVASVDFSKHDYDIFAIRITGFETDGQKDVQLALGAYVIENGKVSYLQEGKPADGQLYTYVSFNSLASYFA